MFGFFSNLFGSSKHNATRPFSLEIRSSKAFITACVSFSIFTDIFLYGVIVPVFPYALSERASIPVNKVQYWTSVLIAVYGSALLAASPIAGWIADHTSSRRSSFIFGLLMLSGGTVLLCIGNSIPILLVGRILQGISAAIVWSVGLALIVDTVGQKGLGEAMGWIGLAMSLGLFCGPLLGGIIFDNGGYVAVYGLPFGLIGVDILFRLLIIEKNDAMKWLDSDAESRETHSEQSVEIQQENEEISQDRPRSQEKSDEENIRIQDADDKKMATTKTDSDLESAEAMQTQPTAPSFLGMKLPPFITLLGSRRFGAAIWGSFVQSILVTGLDAVLPLFVRRTYGWDASIAGVIFLPLVVPSAFAPLVGKMADKYGPRWFATAGFFFMVPLLTCLRFVEKHSTGAKVLLCFLLFIIGCLLTLLMTPLLAEIGAIADLRERRRPGSFGPYGAFAQAYALFNMAFAGGSMVGSLWTGMVVDHAGWATMCWSLAVLVAFSAVPTIIWVGGSIFKNKK